MKIAVVTAVVVAGIACAPWRRLIPAAGGPATGERLTCARLPDSGHLTYWEIGGPQDS
jgi:hypothetical protein